MIWNLMTLIFVGWCVCGLIGTGFDMGYVLSFNWVGSNRGVNSFFEALLTFLCILSGLIVLIHIIKKGHYKYGWRLWPSKSEWGI